MYEFRMPSLGADMEAGTLSKWLVRPGDAVKRGDIVAIIETEKSDIEVEIFASGEVDRILVEKGQRVPVGTLLATLRTNGEAPRQGFEPLAGVGGPSSLRSSPVARRRARELGIDLATVHGTGPDGAVLLADVEKASASPPPRPRAHAVARKMAEALGIDLANIAGTGAGGVITKADVEAAAARPAPLKAPEAPPELARDRAASMRRAIAAAMARSKKEIPHYYLSTEIDMSRALAWLAEENCRRSVEERLLPAAALLKAVALALRKIPELNGFWADGTFRPSREIHLGVAISLRGGGLIAPAIHNADQKSLGELMAALSDLVQRARSGTLRSSEASDPTITVTNLGDQGVETVFGVIYPPQVALVGLGRIVEKPWAENGMLDVRPVLSATLSADHRASDGHRGAAFLVHLDHILQKPEEL